MDEQRRRILDQFTRQAVPFSKLHGNDDSAIPQLLIDTAAIGPDDEVLDVACGPGLVACEVARVARRVAGVDLTPAMIEQAQARQWSLGLDNMLWSVGDADPLAFADRSFSKVITRYTFHHFSNPAAVFDEMVRVCRPGGRVLVADVFCTTTEQGAAYDRMERHRDPSHARALPLAELEALFHGLSDVRRAFYKYPVDVETLLSRSFPDPGGADAFRRTVAADIDAQELGIDANRDDQGNLRFSFPVAVFSGRK